ncbi:MAG TPA: insulinase family protein [Methylothermaceae bacterium]|nr:insulinase family protein [Methylothermaceae bacterium]
MSVNLLRFLPLLLLCPLLVQSGPRIQYWETPAGVRVYYVHNPELPLVDLQVVFAAGSAWDGDRYGLATLTAALLDKGAGDWDADEIAQRLENVGAVLSTGASRDSAWLDLRSLTEADKLEVALETAAGILAHPRFDKRDFEREKKRLLQALKHQEESPGQIAAKQFYKLIYGDHPYAHPPEGEIDTVKAIGREDLAAFHRRYYVARNAMVVIVGAVDHDQADRIARRLTDGLPRGEAAPKIPPVPLPDKARTERRLFPSVQTHIYTGIPVLRRGDPDYFPLYVGNHVLGGGGFTSRIVKEVREKRGLSYSAYSYFMPLKEKGPFVAALQTRNDAASSALEVLQKTIRDYIDQGPTPEELEAAKKNITGGFVLRYDSNAKLADYVAMIGFYHLPLDYLDRFPRQVLQVSREDIVSAFRRRVDPDRFQTVLVGGGATNHGKKE